MGDGFRRQDNGYNSFELRKSTSPNRQETVHMRPSNNFEDITEHEFNKREQNKKQYQNELFKQMNEVKEKKEAEKMKRF